MPEWVEPTARYMFEVGLWGTVRIAVLAVTASAVIGILLGTLMTIRFAPTSALIRMYIEVWRGLSIIVTIFIVFFVFPIAGSALEFDPFTSATIGLSLWGSAQVAEATRGAV